MTKILSVSNMPSRKTVQIRIYDLTAAATTVAWTSVGLSERVAVNKSTYYYTATLTAGHQYEISWQDNSTPIREAVEVLDTSTPTDRGKQGVKRSIMTVGRGVPLAAAVEGANRHDMKLVGATLYQMAIARPDPSEQQPQHLCLDKGYDYDQVRQLLEQWGYTAHIRSRGEEKQQKQDVPGYRARRWVVERTHSWMNRFRALLIRWEKKVGNYLALLHLACAYITLRAATTFQSQ